MTLSFYKLKSYGNVQRIEEGRLPKEVMKWRPPGRIKRGRPKLTWAEGIRGVIGENRLMEEDWNDRNNWRRKIYHCHICAGRCGNIVQPVK